MKTQVDKEKTGRGELLRDEVHSNNELFNQILNQCVHPRRVYFALMALVEPCVEQANNVSQKRKIIVRDLLARLDIAESDK